MKKSNMSIASIAAAAALALSLAGCSTAQLVAQPGPGVQVDPAGTTATTRSGDLTIRAAHVEAPYSLDRRLTAVRLTLINSNPAPVEFIPKDVVLFDQYGAQHFALGPDALLEAAEARVRYPRSHITLGYGYSSYYHHGYHHWYSPMPLYSSGRSYEGLIARALPLRTLTVFPQSNVSGLVYFPIAADDMTSARLRVTRFLRPPQPDAPAPPEESVEFSFVVMKQ